MSSVYVGLCSHEPKIVKKIGIVLGKSYEIPVCKDCKNHPDLQNFKEEVLQN